MVSRTVVFALSLLLTGSVLLNVYQLLDQGVTDTYTEMSWSRCRQMERDTLLIMDGMAARLSQKEFDSMKADLRRKSKDIDIIESEEVGQTAIGSVIFNVDENRISVKDAEL